MQARDRESGVAPQAAADEEYVLAGNEVVMASTLALMTGFSHGCCEAHRGAMAAKVAEQLQWLARSESLSCGMRQLLLRLQQRWQCSAEQASAARAPAPTQAPAPGADHIAARSAAPASHLTTPRVLWHAPLETLQ